MKNIDIIKTSDFGNNIKTKTNIKIFDENNKLIGETKNTLIDAGFDDFIGMFISGNYINKILLSEESNIGVSTSQNLTGDLLNIANTYRYNGSSQSEYIVVFESIAKKSEFSSINTLRSLGLSINDKLITIANGGGIDLSLTNNITIIYSLSITF
jgi:hypothetical protein